MGAKRPAPSASKLRRAYTVQLLQRWRDADAFIRRGLALDASAADFAQFLREGDARGLPKTAEQTPATEDPGNTPIEKKLATMAARVLDENFAAYGEKQCGTCTFRKCCPKQTEGKQLL